MTPRIVNILLSIFCCLSARSQYDFSYLRHLAQNRLQTEHEVYLSRLEPGMSRDSVDYLRLKFALQYRQLSLFEKYQPNLNSLFTKDSSALLLTALWWMEDDFLTSAYPTEWLSSSPFQSVREVTEVIRGAHDPGSFGVPTKWPVDLVETWDRLCLYQSKKPWKAALLSAIAPGSGKWYAGRPRSAMVNTLGLGLFALQMIESYNKLGPRHPLTIGNTIVFGLFYGGNILGSAKAVQQRRLELRNLFYKDAALYYRRLYKPLLY